MPGAKHALDHDHGDAGGSGAEEGEDDYYEVVKTSRKKRKEERDAAHVRVAEYLPEEEAEEKRGINYQMSKNKGLTPHRKIKNPRVKGKVCRNLRVGSDLPALELLGCVAFAVFFS